MKAVVLVGGEGTRMRPLTETIPKPLLPLVDRPILAHVLDHLARHGVHEVVLSSPYLEAVFHPFIQGRHGDPAITWITETEPLGTGGAIVNALDALGEEPFFALNGDILTDLDLTAMLEAHRSAGASVSIALHHVEDARAFGLVEMAEDGRVVAFREKPTAPIPGDVNAGTYLLDPSALREWTPGATISIEREIFPAVIGAGARVQGFLARAYWLDLGTPQTYLRATFDMLEGKVHGVDYAAPFVAPEAQVDLGATLGRWAVVGAGAVVHARVSIEDSVVLPGATLGEGATLTGSIVAEDAVVGAGSTLVDSVIGAGSTVPPGLRLEGARIHAGGTAGATAEPAAGSVEEAPDG
jgi:mannose-1-phosphate guanylyltransferase